MTGGLLRRQRQIAAKVETTEGTAITLAAADANCLVYDPTITDDVPMFDRNPARSSLSPLIEIPGLRTRKVSFKVEIKGSGAIATAPSYGKLLRACGLAEFAVSSLSVGTITTGPFQDGETVTGGTSAATGIVVRQTATGVTTLHIRSIIGTFSAGSETITGSRSTATATETGGASANKGFAYVTNSVEANVPSLTIGSYEDGKRKLISGCRGNVKVSLKDGEPGFLSFDFQGVLSATADVALLTGITYESTIPEPYLTAILVDGSFSPILSTVEIDLGNTLAMRENANLSAGQLSTLITDRRPTGTIDPEAELVGTKDFVADWLAKTVNYFETRIAHNVTPVAGNTVYLLAPAMQVIGVGDGDRSGIALDQLSVAFKTPAASNNGDDEFTIFVQ